MIVFVSAFHKHDDKSIMEEQIIQPGTYVDLTLDIGFKLVFGTEGNEMLMKGLLQAILPHLKIETVLLTNKFEMTFVELKRFNKKISDCASFEEKCYYCLKNMFRLEEQPKELQGDYFDTLFREAMVARFSAEVKNEYIKVMNTEADYRNQLMYAEKKGMEQGREKGRAEGRDEERLRFASFMKSKDFPIEEIIAQTGLTPEAVATL